MNDNEIKFFIFELLAQSPDGQIKIRYLANKYEIKRYHDLCEIIKEMVADKQISLNGEWTALNYSLIHGDTIKYYE